MTPLRKHDMQLRPATTEEIAEIWNDRWFGMVVGIDTVYHPADVMGLAMIDRHDEIVGLVTYHVDGPSGQILTLDTVVRGRGFGGRSGDSRVFRSQRDRSKRSRHRQRRGLVSHDANIGGRACRRARDGRTQPVGT